MNIKSLLASVVLSLLSITSNAASTSGVGYTFNWADEIGLVVNGETLTKTYDFSKTLNSGEYAGGTIDAFTIFMDIDAGYYLESTASMFFNLKSTLIDDSYSIFGTIRFNQAFYEPGSSLFAPGGEYYFWTSTEPLAYNPIPPNGEFFTTSSFGPRSPTRVEYYLDYLVQSHGGTLEVEIQKIEIDFKVLPIPEPSSYAMLGLGLGVLGFASSRRRKTLS